MKKNILLLAMLFFLFSGCDFSIWEIKNKDEKKPIQKKKTIAELKPKHRFSMPLEDVKNEKKFKETAKNILKYELYDIAEVIKETFKKFPNPSEDKDFKIDFEMIMRDFPNLSKEELKANDSLIARYYAVNLDYEVLQILKKTKTPKKEKKDVKLKLNIKDLTRPPMEVREDQAFSKGGNAGVEELRRREAAEREKERKRIQEEEARRAAYQAWIRTPEYKKQRKEMLTKCNPQRGGNSLNPISATLDVMFLSKHGWLSGFSAVFDAIWNAYLFSHHVKPDALKHMYWQGLLCNFYCPIFQPISKLFRMDFAKQVGDNYEYYGYNASDDSDMDYHNNAIGRQIWADRSWHSGWWIFKVLRLPSNRTLFNEAVNKYKKVQIVDKILGSYGNDDKYESAYNNYYKFHYPYYALKLKDKNTGEKTEKDPRPDDIPKLLDDDRTCYRSHWIRNEADKNRPVENDPNQ